MPSSDEKTVGDHPNEDLLVALSEGLLDDLERGQVLIHLDGCRACRELVSSLAGAPDGPADLVGQTILGHHVDSVLSSGGMGVVYKARDDAGEWVALKVLLPHLVDDPQHIGRLKAEARALQKINHPHVVRLLDFGGLPDGSQALIIELLNGESMSARIKRGPVSIALTRRWLRELLSALEATHTAGVLHRDLKPANLFLVAPDEALKVLDFGLARNDGATALTASGVVVGTSGYLAPEFLLGAPPTVQSDLYSVGCIAWKLITGEAVFPRKTMGEELKAHLNEPLPPLPLLPTGLEKLVRALLAKRPDDRPKTAGHALGLAS